MRRGVHHFYFTPLVRAARRSVATQQQQSATPTQSLTSSKHLLPTPQIGDALVYNRYIYYHSAVYIGSGKFLLDQAKQAQESVSESDASPLLPNCRYTVAQAFQAIVSENKIDPNQHYVVHYVPPTGWNLFDKIRHGVSRSFNVEVMSFENAKRGSRIFIVTRPSWVNGKGAGIDGRAVEPSEVLTPLQRDRLYTAVQHYNSQLGGYDFFFNNCQHFATLVAFGKGALYPWSFGQIAIFTFLLTMLIGTAVRSRQTSPEPHSVPLYVYAVLASLLVVSIIAPRHAMIIRLVRCADPK